MQRFLRKNNFWNKKTGNEVEKIDFLNIGYIGSNLENHRS